MTIPANEGSSYSPEVLLGRTPDDLRQTAERDAERLAHEGRALEAMRALFDAEAALGAGFGGVRGSAIGLRHVERSRVHALLRLREYVEETLPALRRMVPRDEIVLGFELEIERAIALCRALLELGWFAQAATVLSSVELALGYLGEYPKQRFDWLRQKASWAFAAREIEEAREAVSEYHALFAAAPRPEGELEELTDELQTWLEVAPVRALVTELTREVRGNAELEARLLAWDIASTLFFPWDAALESELEARLSAPTLPLLCALVDRVGDSLAARAALVPEQTPRPALVEDGGRVLRLLDRLADLTRANGSPELALRARVIAHEQMLDVLAAVREDALASMHPVDASRARELLEEAPWASASRRERLTELQRAADAAPEDPRTMAALVADPLLPADRTVGIASRLLVGEPTDQRLDVAAALVDRSALRPLEERGGERATLELAIAWLEKAVQSSDPVMAMEAREILAGAHELAGNLPTALSHFEELAGYFEGKDHDRWVRAVERCAMLAKQTGRLASAGRAARSGFRPGGKVQPPAPNLQLPTDPQESEEQAERAIAVALRATEPEVGEAWLRRALRLYEMVPDGRRREDEIWERIADLWQDEADALFEEGDATSEQLDDAHRRAHEALVRAIEVNEDLGDGERVFELSGRVLDVLWTWLPRWEDALGAFLTLARQRFRSAMERGDLDHAASALVELRAHLAGFRNDALELDIDEGEAEALIDRFVELEQEMADAVKLETERASEPWWSERLEHRAALLEAHLAGEYEGDD